LDFEGELWTYKRFYLAVQRVGNWLMNDLGIQKGEVVALDGPNSCSYLLLWFALEGIGACPAFINSNLTGESLQHCVKVSHFDVQPALDGRRESYNEKANWRTF
jgi:acyl-CoA synthetase (AMP-forming)/AMP-acid ligase II